MIAINLQTSFLTPPFGFALFYLRGVAPKEIPTQQIYKGVAPFIAIQVFALLLNCIFSSAGATWLPQINILEIIQAKKRRPYRQHERRFKNYKIYILAVWREGWHQLRSKQTIVNRCIPNTKHNHNGSVCCQ